MGNTDDPVLYRSKKIKLFSAAVLFSMFALVSGCTTARQQVNDKPPSVPAAHTATPTPELLISKPSPTPVGDEIFITLTALAEADKKLSLQKTPSYPTAESIIYAQPFTGTYPVTQTYGNHIPGMPADDIHTGIDYACPEGTRILSSADGTVMAANCTKGGFGCCVIIQHPDSRATLYAHLESFNVRNNQRVSRGDVIGFSGSTGYSSGPHLHCEARTIWDDKTSHFDPKYLFEAQ